MADNFLKLMASSISASKNLRKIEAQGIFYQKEGINNRGPIVNFFKKINRFSFSFIEGKINFHERHNSTYEDNEMLQTLLFSLYQKQIS